MPASVTKSDPRALDRLEMTGLLRLRAGDIFIGAPHNENFASLVAIVIDLKNYAFKDEHSSNSR